MELHKLQKILAFYALRKKAIDSKILENQIVMFTTYISYLIFLPAFIYMAISAIQVFVYNSTPEFIFSNYIALVIGIGVFLLLLNILIGDKSFELFYQFLPIKTNLQPVPQWFNDVQFYSHQYTELLNDIINSTIKKYETNPQLYPKIKELVIMQHHYINDCKKRNNEQLFHNLVYIVNYIEKHKPNNST